MQRIKGRAILFPMNEITLKMYVDTHGQTETAKRLGLTQGAVWQMLKSSRQIQIRESDDGSVSWAYERKPIGRFRAEDAA